MDALDETWGFFFHCTSGQHVPSADHWVQIRLTGADGCDVALRLTGADGCDVAFGSFYESRLTLADRYEVVRYVVERLVLLAQGKHGPLEVPLSAAPRVDPPGGWLSLAAVAPRMGVGVLWYLRPCAGIAGHDCYRAGVYLGPNEWRCATTWEAPARVFRDAEVSHWQYLPGPPPLKGL